jgi:inner membrane protein
MIQGLVAERQARRNEVVSGIAEGWGKRQTVAGPYLVVPYEWSYTEVKRETIAGKLNETSVEHKGGEVIYLPASNLEWTVDADITEKARGIYKARLYAAKLTAQGTIEPPVRADYEQPGRRYKWGTPRLVVGVSDPGGIRGAHELMVGGKARTFEPGTSDSALTAGVHAPLGDLELTTREPVEFSFTLEVGGSEAIALAPLGADARVTMRADWPHPSFQGRFLPSRHEIGDSGFSAAWQISRFAQTAESQRCSLPCARVNEQVFVSFVEPANVYQRLERASKYGFLFLGLTFAAIVLIEVLRRVAVHPVQYALVGLALAIFFLLLTALSEHIAFAQAYAIAAAACVGLITLYLVRVLRSLLIGCGLGAALGGLYGMLYVLLQAEDYSLLGGTLLLFALLAAVMLATRKVDWYSLIPAQVR